MTSRALFLALLMTAQAPPAALPAFIAPGQVPPMAEQADPPLADSLVERREDLELAEAVEHFVRAARPTAVPPEPYRGLIAQLGSDCFTCRGMASKRLRALSAGNPRWLLWGRRDPDPEIRLRCNNLLRSLARCDRCEGAGICWRFRAGKFDPDGPCGNCGLWPWAHEIERGQCSRCLGEGSAWTKGAFE